MTFDGYDFGETLHRGVHFVVRRARRADGLPVVVKELGGESMTRERLAEFEREYRITRALEGPGIIRTLAFLRDRHGAAMVLEDFGAISLRAFARGSALPLDDALDIAVRVTRALGEVHRRRVIHKDINPSNIVVNPETREVKIIDFGISTSLSRESAEACGVDSLSGTLPYISPEQTGRMNRSIDSRADLYSLGATLYELFTGQLPFTASDPVELVHSHIAREPLPMHLRVPAIPEGLSRVVQKLLAKTAEDRYQSAFGLGADLEELRAAPTTASFVPGRRDVPDRFHLPQKLYGREPEIAALLETFARAGGGRAELLLIAGYSGIGKSALVHEIHKPILEGRGYFAAGKFDQYQRDTPYSALVQALSGLVRQILTESEARLAAWRTQLQEALGINGQVIADVIPEVELILGPQPPVPPLDPAEAQNRWNLVLHAFLRSLATADHPLALFLDDLQWADAPSLKLLELLVTDPESKHILLIGAYRENEVTAAHPLSLALEALARAGVTPATLRLGPLDLAHVTEMIADTLRTTASRAHPFAELLLEKTAGNPFFLGQFLKSLADDGLLAFDAAQGGWRWDLDSIRSARITDNVVELMVGKIHRLPDRTQRALKLAACIGSRFDLRTLAMASTESPAAAANAVWEAVREGLIIPLGAGARIADPAASEEGYLDEGAEVLYDFLHDRVQQAAYSLFSEDERRAVHLELGRALLAGTKAEDLSDHVFTIVNHLDRGVALITDPEERLAVARLNLLAGKKAKSSSAYEAAHRYLGTAIALLPADAFAEVYELSLEIHTEALAAAYLAGDLARAQEISGIALSRARTILDKVAIHETQLLCLIAQHDFSTTVEVGLSVLELLGHPIPPESEKDGGIGSVLAMERLIGGRPPQSFAELPPMTDPQDLACASILAKLVSPTYIGRPGLFLPTVTALLELHISRGSSPLSPFSYVEYGLIRAAFGDADGGVAWGELAMGMLERLDAKALRAKVLVLVWSFINHWKRHLRDSIEPLFEAIRAGTDTGDVEFGAYAIDLHCLAVFYAGDPLEAFASDVERFMGVLAQLKQEFQRIWLTMLAQVVECLRGLAPDPARLSGRIFDQDRVLPALIESKTSNSLCFFHTSQATLSYLFGDYPAAVASAALAEPHLGAIAGHPTTVHHNFYSSLALVAHAESAPEAERTTLLSKAATNQETLARWAASGPATHQHKHRLVEAERARVEGRQLDAMALYEEAIRGAAEHRFLQEEALANERAALFYLALGRTKIAAAYLAEARACYVAWGAAAKVADLDRRHQSLLAPRRPSRRTVDIHVTQGTTATDEISAALDVSTVLKAARAISGEIVFDRLIDNLMHIVMENAGAQRGVLLIDQGDELVVAADRGGGDGQLARSIVTYVHRTHKPAILGDAASEGLFTADPYVVERRPRSVLCAPIQSGGVLTAVIYLENNLVAGAFTAERVELLKVLSTQAALSLTNARLYADLQRTTERLRESNDQLAEYSRTLEQKVEERTHELTEKNGELGETLDKLRLTQRQLVTQEKLASLGSLTAGIAHELKNPLNFINNFAVLSSGLADELEESLTAEAPDAISAVADVLSDLRGNMGRINEYGRRADDIINGMLLHARRATSVREPADLNAVLAESVNLASHGARAKDPGFAVAIRAEYDPGVGRVELAAQDMSRVFINIFNNAYHAVRAKWQKLGRAYHPTIQVRTKSLGDRVEVRIRDDGAGIPRDVAARIYEPFFTTKPPGEGTGLGLSISHDIVVAGHGGEIRAESEVGEFTEFVITLPRRASR